MSARAVVWDLDETLVCAPGFYACWSVWCAEDEAKMRGNLAAVASVMSPSAATDTVQQIPAGIDQYIYTDAPGQPACILVEALQNYIHRTFAGVVAADCIFINGRFDRCTRRRERKDLTEFQQQVGMAAATPLLFFDNRSPARIDHDPDHHTVVQVEAHTDAVAVDTVADTLGLSLGRRRIAANLFVSQYWKAYTPQETHMATQAGNLWSKYAAWRDETTAA